MHDYILETRGLEKHFGKSYVIRHLSLNIPRGCVYGLLGPNGAGKSTTLKLVAGMLKKSAGEIVFDGAPWTRQSLTRMGVLIESPPLYPNLTARENLKLRCILLGLPEARIDEVLELVDLTHTGKKRSGQFSMGMKQRLGIAIALLNHPDLLILDEPGNGLDPLGIQSLRALIRSFSAQGITVILSSHILSEVALTADHIGIIYDGRLNYEGPIAPEQDLEALFMDIVRKNKGVSPQ